MGKKDREKAASVRSARKWLEQAEQSFDDDSHIKGELNLMLAEAEMKNLRKNHGAKRQKVLRFSALATALLLAGCAFFFLGHGTVPVPAQAAVEQTGSSSKVEANPAAVPAEAAPETVADLPAVDDKGAVEDITVAAPVEEVAPISTAAAAVPEEPAPQQEDPRNQQVTVSEAAPAAPALTDKQLQQVVRDARHSLRGQTNTTR